MGIYEQFEVDFPKRTLRIIEQYETQPHEENENYEVTLLVNCMLGLLVLPYQHLLDRIPDKPLNEIHDWGIHPTYVETWGNTQQPQTMREFVHRLRNGVAHLRIGSEGTNTDITHLEFTDKNGFKARIPVDKLKQFVKKLAATTIQ